MLCCITLQFVFFRLEFTIIKRIIGIRSIELEYLIRAVVEKLSYSKKHYKIKNKIDYLSIRILLHIFYNFANSISNRILWFIPKVFFCF